MRPLREGDPGSSREPDRPSGPGDRGARVRGKRRSRKTERVRKCPVHLAKDFGVYPGDTGMSSGIFRGQVQGVVGTVEFGTY